MSIDELYDACRIGDLDKVKYLVNLGCVPNPDDSYPIELASGFGHLEVVEYFIEVGCDPKAYKIWLFNGHLLKVIWK